MTGKLAYFLIWPIAWLVFPLTRRARVIIVDGNKILLIKDRIGLGKWGLPGGGIKQNEKVEEAASREIHEELGVEINDVIVLNEKPAIAYFSGILLRQHFVKASIIKNSQVKPNWEVDSYEWFSVQDLPNSSKDVAMGLEYFNKINK